jgi:hypothetical protein
VELDELRRLAAGAVRWRIEQAEEFREEVERFTDIMRRP